MNEGQSGRLVPGNHLAQVLPPFPLVGLCTETRHHFPTHSTRQLSRKMSLLLMMLPSESWRTIPDLLFEIALLVMTFPSVTPHYLRVLEVKEVLQAGYGVWVKVNENNVWTINVQ